MELRLLQQWLGSMKECMTATSRGICIKRKRRNNKKKQWEIVSSNKEKKKIKRIVSTRIEKDMGEVSEKLLVR